MTTMPFIETVETSWRMALTAAWSAPFLSPRPTQRPAAIAAASVTRTSSSARLRSGCSPPTRSEPGTLESDMATFVPPSGRGSDGAIVATSPLEHDHGDLGRLHARPDALVAAQPQVRDRLGRDFCDDGRPAVALDPDPRAGPGQLADDDGPGVARAPVRGLAVQGDGVRRYDGQRRGAIRRGGFGDRQPAAAVENDRVSRDATGVGVGAHQLGQPRGA